MMIAEGLVLLGLAYIVVLIAALLTKGACLLRILRFLTRAFPWENARLSLPQAHICRRYHLHRVSVAVLSCLELRVVGLEGELRGSACT